MVSHMEALGKLPEELSFAERNMLTKAYKNAASKRRTAWRTVRRIEKEERAKGNTEHAEYAREYCERLESELEALCESCLDLIGGHLLVRAAAAEAQVFYKKSLADFLRYMAEYREGSAKFEAIEDARKAYEEAWAMSEKNLSKTNPSHLSLALNYSIFQYDFLHNPGVAKEMAKHAVAEAIKDPSPVDSKDKFDFDNIVQSLHANLALWSTDQEGSWKVANSCAYSIASLFSIILPVDAVWKSCSNGRES